MKKNADMDIYRAVGQCAIALINEEADAAIQNSECPVMNAAEMDEWFQKTILPAINHKKQKKHPIAKRILPYAAVFLLFLMGMSALVFTKHEPAKAAFLRFMVERFPRYSEYFIIYDEGEMDRDMAFHKPGYIPEGFTVRQSQDAPDDRFIYWVNEATKQFIGYQEIRNDSSIMLDTEDAVIRRETINGISAEVIVKGNVTTVQFFYDDACYVVITDMSEQECIRIAESILP